VSRCIFCLFAFCHSVCSVAEPCEKTFCAYGANCVQTPDGHAECQCPTECPAMITPVCGTDGVTYTNHCMMRMKSCRQEKNTRVHHAGECGEYQNFLLTLLFRYLVLYKSDSRLVLFEVNSLSVGSFAFH
jgi:hypothetical protein